ncbi:BlaI/MecI/CopY family transcriptional regulator [Clostridium disporicum]|uniref:BlaI/MecI/CopY family transcriptional regulator n=1 Tax=Clostridium disporicum TaxID=84024 RepID=UPI003622C472
MKKFQKLSDTEMEIMTIIWKLNKEVTSSELLSIIEEEKGKKWSGQTIATFLSRMVEKEVLTSIKRGRTNYYISSVTNEEYKQREAEGILNEMYKGSVKKFLSALYYGKKIDKKEIDELKEWFSDK